MEKRIFDGLFYRDVEALIKQLSQISTKLNKPGYLIKSTESNFSNIEDFCDRSIKTLVVRSTDVVKEEDKVLIRRAIKSLKLMGKLAGRVAKKIDKEKIKETVENRNALKKSTLMSLFYYVLELVKASKGLKVELYRQLEINLQGFQKKLTNKNRRAA